MKFPLKLTVGRLAAALAVVVLMASAGCGGQGGAGDGANGGKMTWVTTGDGPRSMQIAMYAVPKELGYFKQEGLNVDLQFSSGSTAGIQAVQSGSGLVTNADAGSIMAASAKGLAFKAFAGVARHWPWQIAVLDSSSIRTPEDLKGKSIGIISLASGSNDYARAVLKLAGIDPASGAKLIPVGVGAAATSALKSGKVDALALYGEVYATMEASGIQLRYLPNASYFDNIFSIAFCTTADNLKNRPKQLSRFATAAFKGLVYASANPEKAVELGIKAFPTLKQTNKDILVATLKAWLQSASYSGDPGTWTGLGSISDEQWNATQEYTLTAGQADSKVPVDQVWDPSILPQLATIDAAKIASDARGSQ